MFDPMPHMIPAGLIASTVLLGASLIGALTSEKQTRADLVMFVIVFCIVVCNILGLVKHYGG